MIRLYGKEEETIVQAKRARLYDALALLTVLLVIALDQWTKSLVVEYLSPPESKPDIPILGKYLVIHYIQNTGAAFGMFKNTIFLALLIVVAIGVVAYLYIRMINSGPLLYKLVFGLIIGGALGNLIDRVHNGGFVVDFIFFRIPEIGYRFAIFNIADACISVGVFLLFVLIIFGGFGGILREKPASKETENTPSSSSSTTSSGKIHSTE